MAAARALYEFDIEVDSVPLLVYREPEAGGRSFVCSVDDAAYEIRCYNHSAEPLSGTVSIDSKEQPSKTAIYERTAGVLPTLVMGASGQVEELEFRFVGNAPVDASRDVMVPLESLEKLGRIDVTCRPCYRSRKQEPDAIPEAFTTAARIEEAQPDIAVPLAKRKVAPPTSRAISRPPKVAHTFSEYNTDMSKPPLAVLTLHYRPARLLRYYGLVGLYTPDVTWPTWVREQQLSRVPGLAAPPTPVVAPRARTPAAFTRPAVAETQPLVRVDVVATKPALRKHAESNALILQEESADLYTILSKLLWDTTQYAQLANLCVAFQRSAENARHYNALVNKKGWSEAAVHLKAFSDFFQVPVVLYTPGAVPEVQALISPLMQFPERCFAISLLRESWVALGAGEEKPVILDLADD